jgi:hypothetical protein
MCDLGRPQAVKNATALKILRKSGSSLKGADTHNLLTDNEQDIGYVSCGNVTFGLIHPQAPKNSTARQNQYENKKKQQTWMQKLFGLNRYVMDHRRSKTEKVKKVIVRNTPSYSHDCHILLFCRGQRLCMLAPFSAFSMFSAYLLWHFRT